MRTKPEIDAEIEALKALVPVGPYESMTQLRIALAIEELMIGVDTTAEEWNELSSGQQETVIFTREWKNGQTNERPSVGWGTLVK